MYFYIFLTYNKQGLKKITEGETVEYEIGESRGKPKAVNIKKV